MYGKNTLTCLAQNSLTTYLLTYSHTHTHARTLTYAESTRYSLQYVCRVVILFCRAVE